MGLKKEQVEQIKVSKGQVIQLFFAQLVVYFSKKRFKNKYFSKKSAR